MDIRKLDPMELANRYLAINTMVMFYDAAEIEKVNPNMVEYIDVDKNGTWISIPQVDLTYCLFKAPTAEFTQLMKELARLDQNKMEKIVEILNDRPMIPEDELVPDLKKHPKENTRLKELISQVKETLRRQKKRQEEFAEAERKRAGMSVIREDEATGTIIDTKPTEDIPQIVH